MFSYYGSKSKIIKKYPKPKFNTIIEPFAGSARYALEYWENDVMLFEKYEKVAAVWEYLKNASKDDIMRLPNITPSTKLSSISEYNQLCQEEKWLIGFSSNQGSAYPKNYSGARNGWNRSKEKIANSLFKIRHWKIFNQSYESSPDVVATWYIDPPYQDKGKWYAAGCENKHLDYISLGNWCRSRKGQVIVCESEGADWMDFKPLVELSGQKRKTLEMIWTNTS